MSTYIDRNPELMMKYADDAKTILDEMHLVIIKVEGLLDSYAKDLDDPTREQIEVLKTCCDDYFKQMDVYRNIAQSVYDKGKRLREIREEG